MINDERLTFIVIVALTILVLYTYSHLRLARIRDVVNINIAIIILAAGLSERMGVFKPLLPVGAQPAIARCINTAKSAGVRDVIVVTGNMRGELEAAVREIAPLTHLVHNAGFNDGMFSSACTGVGALGDDIDSFFLLPSDCCAVSPDTLVTLIRHFTDSDRASVIRSRFGDKRGHPPLIPARYKNPLTLYKGENGLKGFLAPLPTIEVEMGAPDSLLDMDTPEDYSELLGFLGLPVYPTREQCEELFAKYDTPPDIIAHGEHVAALALKVARLIERDGVSVSFDFTLLESACLVHDIFRMEPDHARAGMELLLREGYPKAAVLVGDHMDLPGKTGAVGEAEHPVFIGTISETELLFLADKLCRRGKYAALSDTMRDIESRFSQDPGALEGARRRISTAQAIFNNLIASYDISYKKLGIHT